MMKLLIGLTVALLLSACESGKNEDIVKACFVDGPANGTQLSTNQDFKIVGWAYDKENASSPGTVSVELSGEDIKTFVATRVSRPDVVKAFNTPGAEMSGYEATVPANSLIAGQYEITIWQETPERKLKCVTSHMIEITGEIKPVATVAPSTPPVSTPPAVIPEPPVVTPVQAPTTPPVNTPTVIPPPSVATPVQAVNEPAKVPEKSKVPVKKPKVHKKKTEATVEK
jgi:hypothetical protein